MKLRKKHTLFLGVALLAAGLLTLLSVFVYIGFDFTKLNGTDLTQKTVSIEEPFDSISIDADWFNVAVQAQSESEQPEIIIPEGQNLHTELKVVDGVLSVTVKDTRPWYERFFSFTPDEFGTVTVCLPRGDYHELKIVASSGDVTVDGGLPEVLFFEETRIQTSSGEVTVKEHSSNFISIETSSGDVLCDGISSKRFSVITSSGDVECPPSAQKGDYCEVKTSSGDVTIINTPT